MTKDITGKEFKQGQKVAYAYQAYKGTSIILKIGYVVRTTPKTVGIMETMEWDSTIQKYAKLTDPARVIIIDEEECRS